MGRIGRVLFALLCFVAVAQAEPRPCIDTLASAQYPGALDAIPNHIAISGFAKTFGDFFPVAKKQLDKGRSFIRVPLLWRDDHNYQKSDLKAAIKEARRYNILCGAYPGRLEISPFTEHNLSNPDPWLDDVQKAAPNCRVVNTPWKGKLSKKFKNEVHGNHSKPDKPYNYSYDGTNSVDSDVTADKKKWADAEMFCLWHPRLNLKWSMKDPAGRPQRIKEAKQRKPSKKLLESLVYLFSDRGPVSIQKHWLVKSHSERHEFNDLKGDKLLIISPIKAQAVQLKRAGKTIGKLPYYGSFDGGGYRYYAPKFGYEYGRAEVCIKKKCFGSVNAGFRLDNR